MNPPVATDSLYKFLALSGLAIVLLLPIYYFGQSRDRNRDLVQTETQVLMLGEDWDFLKFEVQNITNLQNKALDDIEKFSKELHKIHTQVDQIGQLDDANELIRQLDELKQVSASIKKGSETRAVLRKLQKTLAELSKKSHELGGKRTEIKLIDRELTELKLFLCIAWPIGLVLSTLGFFLWYVRLQCYLDMAVKQETEGGDAEGEA